MADISKIKPNGANGTEYDVKDATARSALENKANNTQTFTEASTRANIASGETMSTLFGKIKKFFTDLKTVAFTGSYNDLSNKPTIPAAQVQSNWTQTTTTAVDYIKNKPTIPAAVAVKGNAESSYRTGNVNLTPANIGAATVSDAEIAGRNAALTYVTANAVPKATADADGNVISSTYSKTDEKVTQTATTTDSNSYQILFSGTADNTTRTEGARKASSVQINPNKGRVIVDELQIRAIGSNSYKATLLWANLSNKDFQLPDDTAASGVVPTLATREYLNSNCLPYAPTSVTLTAASGTLNSYFCYKFGRLVILQFQITGAFSAGSAVKIINGAPKPSAAIQFSGYYFGSNSDHAKRFSIDTTGSIYYHWNATASNTSGPCVAQLAYYAAS